MADIKHHSTLPTSLVSVWLSDGSGLTTDLHGSNTATNSGATLATGVNGDAASFTASESDYINTNYAPTLSSDAHMSVSLWVKTTYGSSGTVFGAIREGGTNDPKFKIGYADVTTGDVNCSTLPDGGTNVFANADAYPVNDGSWHHVVGVRDGTNNEVAIYVDGNKTSEADTRTDSWTFTGNPFYIGANNLRTVAAEFVDATIHQVCFWTKALTSTEVSALYNSGSGIPYDTPLYVSVANPQIQGVKIVT